MQTDITPEQSADFLRRLRFPRDLEREFQTSYLKRMLPAIRTSVLILLLISLIGVSVAGRTRGGMDYARPSVVLLTVSYLLQMVILIASFRRDFVHYWQGSVVFSALVYQAGMISTDVEVLMPLAVIGLIVTASRLQRLQFRWMCAQILGMVIVFILSEIVVPSKSSTTETMIAFVLLSLVLIAIPLIGTYRAERFERGEFLTKYLLAQDRNEERIKREHTEQMLHILGQAIGGIVHDLGNPLTTVQSGAQTLLDFSQDGEVEPAMVQDLAAMITDGAQMLNYLRLSLMEQTRVLEDKPVPVTLAPTSLGAMIKAGTRYQKPKFATGRRVMADGEDVEVCVDEMRFITVFMNLIGNALKYSDGEVRITWRTHGAHILVAVQDQGQAGRGITQAQAEKLFVPFGRLDTHAKIEGTGLGLLSVRKIAQAHSGEVYIEGTQDGTSASPPFCTAQGSYPILLGQGFATAFVVTCTHRSAPQPEKVLERATADAAPASARVNTA